MRRERLALVLFFLLAECGGKDVIYEYSARAAGGAGPNSGPGGDGPIAGTGTAGITSSLGGAVPMGGAAPMGGIGNAATGGTGNAANAGVGGDMGRAGMTSQIACVQAADCPKPSNACVLATCVAQACSTENVAPGKLFVPDSPADCHAVTACNGSGVASVAVDQTDVPTPTNPCLAGTCNSSGMAGTEVRPAGTRCLSASGGVLCDGAGSCVQCLGGTDCPAGQNCAATHECVSAPCTDVSCGGVCPPCALGKKCLVDADCSSNACDAVTLTCVSKQCLDHQQDGLETDADCGGGICPACALDKACLLDSDCLTTACDSISRVCVRSQCGDHRQDGSESDVDCGGTNTCNGCAVGQRCNMNFDCQVGHSCSLTSPRVCL